MKSQYQRSKDLAMSPEDILRFERVADCPRKQIVKITAWEGSANGDLNCTGIVMDFPTNWLSDVLEALQNSKTFIETEVDSMDEWDITTIGGSDTSKADVLNVDVAKHPNEVIVRVGYYRKSGVDQNISDPHICVPSQFLPRLIEIFESLNGDQIYGVAL